MCPIPLCTLAQCSLFLPSEHSLLISVKGRSCRVDQGWVGLCPGDQVGSEGKQAIDPLTGPLQQGLPQLLLLRRGVHPGHLEPIATACRCQKERERWACCIAQTPRDTCLVSDALKPHDTPPHPRQISGATKAQGWAREVTEALLVSPVPRLRRVPPSWRLPRVPWSQSESSAQAWRRSAGPKPS